MENEIVALLSQATLYCALNVGFRKMLGRPLVSAALAFWTGWIFLLFGGSIVFANGWGNISSQSAPYLETLFLGAFLGFALGSLVGVSGGDRSSYLRLVDVAALFLDKYGNKVLALLFVVGCAFLMQRISVVGLKGSFLTDVRSVYNERGWSVLGQAGSHLSVLMTTFIMVRGVYDSFHGVRTRSLAITILAGAPLGLANGGRTFLMTYVLAYAASLLVSRSHYLRTSAILSRGEVVSMGALFAVILVTFATMGFVRGGYGSELNIAYTILIWPVSTLEAMDSWVFAALNNEQTYGANSFGWVLSFLNRLGVVDMSESYQLLERVNFQFVRTGDTAAVVPRSILPDLIFDFGAEWLVFSMLCTAFVLELVTSVCVGRGIFMQVFAAQCLVASFVTVQNSVVTPGFAASLFWAAALAVIARSYGWLR